MSHTRWEPNWRKIVPYVLMHILAVGGAIRVGCTPKLFALCIGLYMFRMFVVGAGYHRYFSHRAFKTSRMMQFILAWLANTTLMRGPLVWASAHRYHHRHSDTEKDLHSALQDGFLWSHTLWFLSKDYERTQTSSVRDLEKYPELVWINTYYFLPAYLSGLILYWIGGWPAFVWGFLVSVVLSWHATFSINSLCHIFGSQRFQTQDGSKNNLWLALLTWGEGWHNNHHYSMQSARQGFYWWEIDLTYYGLKVLEKMGLIWDLTPPPPLPKNPLKSELESNTARRIKINPI